MGYVGSLRLPWVGYSLDFLSCLCGSERYVNLKLDFLEKNAKDA